MTDHTDNNQPALKPCPFCGSHAHVRETKAHGALPIYWVECVICEIGTKYHESPMLAAQTWNSRIGAPAEQSDSTDINEPDFTRCSEVAQCAQAVLTALNVGDVKSGSLLHLKLREVMIAYREGGSALTDERVDAFIREHESDPVDEAQLERVRQLFNNKLAATSLSQPDDEGGSEL